MQEKQHTYDLFVKVLRDEHMSVAPSMSADEITAHTDVDPDIFNLSGDIDREKGSILYNTSGDTVDPNDPFGGW